MDKKLTLSLDARIIEESKELAKEENTSLSRLIENYLATLIRRRKSKEDEGTAFVKSIGKKIQDSDYDEKADYRDYLEKKYR